MTKTIYITYSRYYGGRWKLDEVFSSMKNLDKFYCLKRDYSKSKNNVFTRCCKVEFLKIIKQEIQI
jgi:hypothetical protein